MLRNFLVCVLLATATISATALDHPPANLNRRTYVAKYAAAKELGDILAKHFKGAAEFQTGPEGTSNFLIINATPSVFEEVMQTLEQLDRRPRSVTVEVFVFNLPAKKGDNKEKGPYEKDFSGSINDVAERLASMMKKGQIACFKHIKLTTLDGQLSSERLGKDERFVTNATRLPTGLTNRMFGFRSVGTQVNVTPRITVDGSITLDLSVQESRRRDSATKTVGIDENGSPIALSEFPETSFAGKIIVASGKAALAKDAKLISKDGEEETLFIVGARVTDSEVKGN